MVRQNLEFDVTRLHDVAFEQHRVVAEGAERFAFGSRECVVELGEIVDDAHPTAAASCASLYEHGRSDARSFRAHRFDALICSVVARHDGNVVFASTALRFDLVAHRGDRFGRRADEDDPRLDHRSREGRAFGEKAVAGMQGIRAQLECRSDDVRDIEVRFARGAGAALAVGLLLGLGAASFAAAASSMSLT